MQSKNVMSTSWQLQASYGATGRSKQQLQACCRAPGRSKYLLQNCCGATGPQGCSRPAAEPLGAHLLEITPLVSLHLETVHSVTCHTMHGGARVHTSIYIYVHQTCVRTQTFFFVEIQSRPVSHHRQSWQSDYSARLG